MAKEALGSGNKASQARRPLHIDRFSEGYLECVGRLLFPHVTRNLELIWYVESWFRSLAALGIVMPEVFFPLHLLPTLHRVANDCRQVYALF